MNNASKKRANLFSSKSNLLNRRLSRVKTTFAMSLLALIVTVGRGAESPQLVKGTRVTLTPPAGFTVADRFPGFVCEEGGVIIVVTELAVPFKEASVGFNADGFGKKGVVLLSREEMSFGNYNGLLMSVSQSANGVDFLKWISAFGDEQITYLVTAAFPKQLEAEMSDLLKKSVLGARVSSAQVDPLSGLNFSLTPTNEMKLAKVFGNTVLLTKGGAAPVKSVDVPVFIGGASISIGMVVPDKKAFAENRLQKTATLTNVTVTVSERVTIDGLDGYESVGAALHAESGTKMCLYQVALFDTDGYYLMQGIGSEVEGKAQLPTFKEIARSFRRTNSQNSSAKGDQPAPRSPK